MMILPRLDRHFVKRVNFAEETTLELYLVRPYNDLLK